MSARLTMNVSGKIRWAKVRSSRLLPRVKEHVITEANRLNREIVPRGLTGKLQDSFTVEQTDRSLRFYWSAPYAKFVDQGTSESAGRYVPVLGKRLVNKELTTRQQVHKLARKMEIPERIARAALKTPIIRRSEEHELFEETWGAPYYEKKLFGVRVSKAVTSAARKYGYIAISTETPSEKLAATERHELWHAVQTAALKREVKIKEGKVSVTGLRKIHVGMESSFKALLSYSKEWPESGAYWAELAAGRISKDIGTHHGIRAQHFSTKISDSLRNTVVQFTKETIHEALR